MEEDKYTAVWVSHSSIRDFLNCPKAYYYKHIYRDPQTGNKIKIISPPLSLGQAVHEVIESLSVLPVEKRFNESLIDKFDQAWERISGKRGGFLSERVEKDYKNRGKEMLRKVTQSPGPLKKLAVKINMELPHYWFSKEENIILCGKIDWLEYMQETDSVHIIDFKTGKQKEDAESLQLPIYHLLVENCQKRNVQKASYWYIAHTDELTEKELPGLKESKERVMQVAKKVKLARQLERFKCPQGDKGCFYCNRLKRVVAGEGEKVGTDEYGSDIYILDKKRENIKQSKIL